MTTAATSLTPQGYLQAQSRWHPLEIAFWLATLLPFVLFPELSVAGKPDRHHGAVRALARHYPRLCRHRFARPRGVFRHRRLYRRACSRNSSGASRSPASYSPRRLPALVGYAVSFIICALPPSHPDHDHAWPRSAGCIEAANSAHWLTGGSDGLQGVSIWPVFGTVQVRSLRLHRLHLFAGRPVPGFPGRAAADQFAVRSGAARHSRKLGAHAGDRRRQPRPYPQGLHHCRGHRRPCRRACWRRPPRASRLNRSASSAPPTCW